MLTIRRIKHGESQCYRELRLKSLQESPSAFGSTYADALTRSPESWVEQADGSVSSHDRATFIAFWSEAPIGLAALYRMEAYPDIGELIQVWIDPEFRKKGVASALMDAVFVWAGANGFKQISAGIMAGNAGAMKFYQRYGFVTETGIILNCPGDAAVLIKDVK